MKPFNLHVSAACFYLILGLASIANAQSPNALLYNVYQKIHKANDYVVDARIKSDIPMVKILPVKATIYFKQENKYKVESKSIAMLPKQGLNDFSSALKDTTSFTAVVSGIEKIRAVETKIINVIPHDNSGDLIISKLWVDPVKLLIMQSELTTRSSGTMLIEYFYKNQATYGLPDSLIFTVDVKKFKMPKGLAADINKSPVRTTENDSKPQKKGKIFIGLSNYRINQGLKDDFFTKNKK